MPSPPASPPFPALTADARRTFYAQHRAVAIVLIALVFIAPFVGLYLAGLLGAAIAVGLSALVYSLMPLLWQWVDGSPR